MRATELFSSDPLTSAVAAGLRYVRDSAPGIRRRRCRNHFRYIGPHGRPIRDRSVLKRIKSLVIPPAWSDVWICGSAFGHIQAVGWDAKGRKQYRYHPLYRQVRDQAKFSRMIAFGTMLNLIRRQVQAHLDLPGMPREKVLASAVRLLETTFMRVGNAEYARDNESFGLTTLRNRHVRVHGATLAFHFRGKSGQTHTIELTDRRLARIIRQCQEIPGYELFQYVDENGKIRKVDSADVNHYLRDLTGQEFTAKDFRTWAGTLLAARELNAAGPCRSASEGKRKIAGAVKRVAERLGNRPSACRKYYIHPAIIDAYSDGSLFEIMQQGVQQNTAYAGLGLQPEEYCVMVIIAEYTETLAKEAEKTAVRRHAA